MPQEMPRTRMRARTRRLLHAIVHHVLLLLLLHDLRLNSSNMISTLLLGLFALATDQLLHPHFRTALESNSILLGDLRRILRGRAILRHIATGHFLAQTE